MTKLIKRLKDYSYRERLEKLRWTILLQRRIRGDLLEMFKIMEFLIIKFFRYWKFTVKTDLKNEGYKWIGFLC